jgi:hypothetical protein
MTDERPSLFAAAGGWCTPSEVVRAYHDELGFEPVHYPEVKALRSPRFDLDDNSMTYEYEIDTGSIVHEMLERIVAAEEGVREQVMVEWLRSHGWTVERIKP